MCVCVCVFTVCLLQADRENAYLYDQTSHAINRHFDHLIRELDARRNKMLEDLEELTIAGAEERRIQLTQVKAYADSLETGAGWVEQVCFATARTTAEVEKQVKDKPAPPSQIKKSIVSDDGEDVAPSSKQQTKIALPPVIKDSVLCDQQQTATMDKVFRNLRLFFQELRSVLYVTYDSANLTARPLPTYAAFTLTESDAAFNTADMGRLELYRPSIEHCLLTGEVNGKAIVPRSVVSYNALRAVNPDAAPPPPYAVQTDVFCFRLNVDGIMCGFEVLLNFECIYSVLFILSSLGGVLCVSVCLCVYVSVWWELFSFVWVNLCACKCKCI